MVVETKNLKDVLKEFGHKELKAQKIVIIEVNKVILLN